LGFLGDVLAGVVWGGVLLVDLLLVGALGFLGDVLAGVVWGGVLLVDLFLTQPLPSYQV